MCPTHRVDTWPEPLDPPGSSPNYDVLRVPGGLIPPRAPPAPALHELRVWKTSWVEATWKVPEWQAGAGLALTPCALALKPPVCLGMGLLSSSGSLPQHSLGGFWKVLHFQAPGLSSVCGIWPQPGPVCFLSPGSSSCLVLSPSCVYLDVKSCRCQAGSSLQPQHTAASRSHMCLLICPDGGAVVTRPWGPRWSASMEAGRPQAGICPVQTTGG